MAQSDEALLAKVERLKFILISRAIGRSWKREEYRTLRQSLLHTSRISSQLPAFLRSCQTLDKFWEQISQKSKTHAERRRYIRDAFGTAVSALETRAMEKTNRPRQPIKRPGTARRLTAFLCHSLGDKPVVHDIHTKLQAHGFQAWLDDVDLLPGQDWQEEIAKAVRNSDVVLVCLSSNSIAKDGFVQREISYALDRVLEKPQGVIYIIPVKIEECDVPDRLRRWQWVNYYQPDGLQRLIASLLQVATALTLRATSGASAEQTSPSRAKNPTSARNKRAASTRSKKPERPKIIM